MKNCIRNRCNSMCVSVLFSTNSITNFPATQVEEAGGGGESRRSSSRQSWWAMRMTTMLKLITPGELKCQLCQSCQQCGLFRRLILDLVTRGGGGGSTRGSSVGKSSLLLRLSRQSQCLLSTGKGGGGWWRRWRCLKCLSSGPRQLRGAKPLEIVRVLRA